MTVQQVILQHILNAPPVPPRPALHVAIITDGNGRWATSRGLQRSAGHRAGAEASRAIIEAAPKLGIRTLSLFALSSANWQRPPAEVNCILRLLHEYLMAETTRCMENGIRISILGRRDRIPATLRQAIIDSEAAAARGCTCVWRLTIRRARRFIWRLAATTRRRSCRRSRSAACYRKFREVVRPMWTC